MKTPGQICVEINNQLLAVKFYPRLHQPQLFARYFPGKNLAVPNADGRFKLGVLRVDVRQVVVFVVDEIQANDGRPACGASLHGPGRLT